MKTKAINTSTRNLMSAYIGKTYEFDGNLVTIKKIMEDGYFLTEVNEDGVVYQSNASFGEIKNGVKNGLYKEI